MTFPNLPPREAEKLERRFQKLDKKLAKRHRKELKEVHRKGGTLPGHRNWVPAPERRSGARNWAAAVLLLALFTGAGYWVSSGENPNAYGTLAQRGDIPPPGVDASDEPLGTPPAVEGEGGYSFLQMQDDKKTPITWDPCRPIRYVLSGETPAGAEGMLEEAIAEMSRASGLQFVYAGITDEQPSGSYRDSYQEGRYGKRWAPVLISWTSPEAVADLGGGTVGTAGPDLWRSGDGTYVYTSGRVNLDAPQFAEAILHQGPAGMKAVLMHELGHLLGLDHHNDPAQLMYAESVDGVTQLGEGDRRGLARLGAGPCRKDI